MRAADGKMRMTDVVDTELILNMLAEATTSEISKERKPETFTESEAIAVQSGQIAGNTRREIEAQTGKNVISPLNAKDRLQLKDWHIFSFI